MKKSLVALAVLGAFAGAASAQSSVTIYGLLDMGVTRSNGGVAPNPGVDPAKRNAWTLQNSTASRLGFRGTEDLGGGLSAQFQIEHRFTPDDGQQLAGAPFWGARSYVQLTSNKAGSVYLGREYAPAFWVQVKADPFGNNGVGQAGSAALWAGYTQLDPSVAAGTRVRTSNSVGYRSPKFGGLSFELAGSGAENHNTGRQLGANAEWTQGPIWAAVGYATRDRVAGPPVNFWNDNNLVNVAFSYDFGFVKPVAYWARAETGTSGNFKSDVWMVGLTAPLVGGKVKAMYYAVDPSDAAGTPFPTANRNDRKKLGVGYDYPLSKRTNLYLDFGYARADLAGGGTTNNRAASFGVLHSF